MGAITHATPQEVISTTRYLTVLYLLADQPEALSVQLGLIWLDGHGWGQMSLNTLGALICGVRDVCKLQGW